jgi:hypothetical protein
MAKGRCKHIRFSFLVPGWACCHCAIYNGYQRITCRQCGHPPCYETESQEGREALVLKEIGDKPEELRQWMEQAKKPAN